MSEKTDHLSVVTSPVVAHTFRENRYISVGKLWENIFFSNENKMMTCRYVKVLFWPGILSHVSSNRIAQWNKDKQIIFYMKLHFSKVQITLYTYYTILAQIHAYVREKIYQFIKPTRRRTSPTSLEKSWNHIAIP